MADEVLASHFDSIFQELLDQKNVRQAVAGVRGSNPAFDWIGTGVASGSGREKFGPDTPFFIASIDKLFNATILMLLAEQGRIDLDESMVTFFPDEVTAGLHILGGKDYTPEITVRHLLTHTSGLPDWLEESPRNGTSLIAKIFDAGDIPFTFEQFIRVVSDDLTPHFPPQDLSQKKVKIRYSDTNFILISRIIETIAGQPLHQVHRELLYEPLDLTHTYFPGQKEPMEAVPPSLPLLADGEPIEIPHLMEFINGIYSTTEDMITFQRKLVSGEIFQSRETLSTMRENWRRFGFPMDAAALRTPGWPIEYGMGMMRFQLPRLFTGLRRLPAVIGHTGSTGCWLFWCPEYDVYLAGSVDEATAGAVPFKVVPKFLKVIRGGR